MGKKPMPIGVDNFKNLITNGYYYVDKTLLIKEILDLKGEANLFTRPRRFRKTLNLSMLRYFFEDTGNAEENQTNRKLFDGLKITEAGEQYTEKMGKYPVITMTLKSAKQGSFAESYYQLRAAIIEEFERHVNVIRCSELSDRKKKAYEEICAGSAPKEAYYTAIKFLSECLYSATGQKVIILLDEYDVPLENAHFCGFYTEMANFIRSLFESALKTNEYLEFAVITGCLRISKESIFTGLNHLEMNSILSANYSEHFGFTEKEVLEMVSYYGHENKISVIKEWYDGYRFGKSEVYNPWSVIKFIKELNGDAGVMPVPYWINTSTNRIIRDLIDHAGTEERKQIEALIAGGTIEVPVHEEVTYEDMSACGDALWNFLFFTGYLTKVGERLQEGTQMLLVELEIPNIEVRQVYQTTILSWFRDELKKRDFRDLYQAMENGDAVAMQEIINEQLGRSISFYDSAENFYHGFMTGLLSQSGNYYVKSNRETGDGRSDIMVYPPNLEKRAFVLELKVSEKFKDAVSDAEAAVGQIQEKHYSAELEDIGYEDIHIYGIAFFRKNCKVCYGGSIEV